MCDTPTPICCRARKVNVPSVDSGLFSVLKKSKETISEAVNLWNPSCYDAISFDGGYQRLRGNHQG